MQKAGVKAFVYSFSVSLFAICVANKAFLRAPVSENNNLNIAGKSIALFVKKNQTSHNPSKKIFLSSLPALEFNVANNESGDAVFVGEMIVDEPLGVVDDEVSKKVILAENEKKSSAIVAEIVYSEEKPLIEEKITSDTVYEPENIVVAELSPPEKPEVFEENPAVVFEGDSSPAKEKVFDDVKIPLQSGKNILIANKVVKIGDSDDMNQVALSEQNIPIESMNNNQNDAVVGGKTGGVWAQAESTGSKNEMAPGVRSQDEPVEDKGVAYSGTVKNLIIPIPQKVSNTEVLTPKLAYPEDGEDIKREKAVAESNQGVLTKLDSAADILFAKKKTEPKKNAVGDLSSLFGLSKKNKKEQAISKAKERIAKDVAEMEATLSSAILPKEIRLSFRPDKAEISGQTLKWIQAFGLKAAKDNDIRLEIRMDGSVSMALQQKRLNMLYNILLNKGVEYSKINTVFTSREPNSFVLRTLAVDRSRIEYGGSKKEATNNQHNYKRYIQW